VSDKHRYEHGSSPWRHLGALTATGRSIGQQSTECVVRGGRRPWSSLPNHSKSPSSPQEKRAPLRAEWTRQTGRSRMSLRVPGKSRTQPHPQGGFPSERR
jgi:hypothetical protein